MKKIITTLFFTVLSFNSQADANTSCDDILPQITLQLSAQDWVTTQTAKVSVTLDALFNREQIAKAQDNFQSSLKRIAPEVIWHITEFSRSPGKTSLEQLHAVAEARLPDTALAGLRERVHALNSEGQTYTVQDIIYSPSTAEINITKSKLRMQIYDQAKAELDRINAIYPGQGYNLYNINFVNLSVQPGPMMTKMNTVVALTREMPSVSLSQQMTQDALVVFAGNCR